MADDKNFQAHTATYASVISLLFRGAIAAAVVAFFVIWLIAPAAK